MGELEKLNQGCIWREVRITKVSKIEREGGEEKGLAVDEEVYCDGGYFRKWWCDDRSAEIGWSFGTNRCSEGERGLTNDLHTRSS